MAVFYSFHYERDAARFQQIINMGVVEGQPLLQSQQWESVRRQGRAAVQRWIDDQMKYKTAVVVLVGRETSTREWVDYEIRKAWDDKRPLVGIRINGLAPLNLRQDPPGANPFATVTLRSGNTIADYAPLYTPAGSSSAEVYSSIKRNLSSWVASAYRRL